MPLRRVRRWVVLLFVFTLSCASPPGVAQPAPPDDPVEARIVEAVDAWNAEALDLLIRLIDVNSGTMHFEGVEAVGRMLQAEFDALGFETRWVDGAPFGRAGHLVAEHDGPGPRLLLIGHLDTVFEPDSPFQRYERLDDQTARGPGIADMKGGDVIMLAALRALGEAGVLDRLNLEIVLTGDEEDSGRPLALSKQALVEAADRADIAIGFENGDGDPATAVISRRGSTRWRLEVEGTPAHSSQIFRADVGAGAIFEAARILDGFYTALADEPMLTFNPGLILGGTEVDYDEAQDRGTAFGKDNVVAERAVAAGDIRALSPEQLRDARAAMQAIVADSRPGTSATLTFDEGYPPLAPTDGNRRLLALYDRVSRDLGFGAVTAVDPRRAGAADVSFTSGRVEMAIDGIGMAGADDHTVRETGRVDLLPMLTKRAAVLLYRLSRG